MQEQRRFGKKIGERLPRSPFEFKDTVFEKHFQHRDCLAEMLFVRNDSGLSPVFVDNTTYDLAIPHTGFAATEGIAL